MDELVQQGNTNLALCLIKLDDWEAARVNLIEGSKGSNLKVKSKALYWLVKYYIRVSEPSKAQDAIDVLSSMDIPFNACSE